MLKETLLNKQSKPIILLDEFEKAKDKLVQIQGTLTSRIEVKPSTDIPAYGFFKLDNQEQEIPVIFRIKDNQESWNKPKISKGSNCLLTGEWKGSKESKRPSFTAYSYQIQLVKAQIEAYQSKENHG